MEERWWWNSVEGSGLLLMAGHVREREVALEGRTAAGVVKIGMMREHTRRCKCISRGLSGCHWFNLCVLIYIFHSVFIPVGCLSNLHALPFLHLR